MKLFFGIIFLLSIQTYAGLGEVPKDCISALDKVVANYKKTYEEALKAWKSSGFSQKDLDYYIVYYLSHRGWPGGPNSAIKNRIGVGLTVRIEGALANAQGNAGFCKVSQIKKYKISHPEMSEQQVRDSDDIRDIYGQAIDYFYSGAGINWDLLNSPSPSPTKKTQSAR